MCSGQFLIFLHLRLAAKIFSRLVSLKQRMQVHLALRLPDWNMLAACGALPPDVHTISSRGLDVSRSSREHTWTHGVPE